MSNNRSLKPSAMNIRKYFNVTKSSMVWLATTKPNSKIGFIALSKFRGYGQTKLNYTFQWYFRGRSLVCFGVMNSEERYKPFFTLPLTKLRGLKRSQLRGHDHVK